MPRFDVTLESLIEECKRDPDILRHLPNLTSKKKTYNREFVVNVLATMHKEFVRVAVDMGYATKIGAQT